MQFDGVFMTHTVPGEHLAVWQLLGEVKPEAEVELGVRQTEPPQVVLQHFLLPWHPSSLPQVVSDSQMSLLDAGHCPGFSRVAVEGIHLGFDPPLGQGSRTHTIPSVTHC